MQRPSFLGRGRQINVDALSPENSEIVSGSLRGLEMVLVILHIVIMQIKICVGILTNHAPRYWWLNISFQHTLYRQCAAPTPSAGTVLLKVRCRAIFELPSASTAVLDLVMSGFVE
jgi:hypothetical protein